MADRLVEINSSTHISVYSVIILLSRPNVSIQKMKEQPSGLQGQQH